MNSTITVSTWGRFGDHEKLGTIRVRLDGVSSPSDCAARSIARRLHLGVATLRADGAAVERGREYERHFVTTLGRPCPDGGWIPEAEVWFSVPIAAAKDPAAVALGSRRTSKKAASSARNARLGGALGGRPKLVYTDEREWSTVRIFASKRGWTIETDSRAQGSITGARYALDYSDDIPHGQDLAAPWNNGLSYADILMERRTTGRCIRHGFEVR